MVVLIHKDFMLGKTKGGGARDASVRGCSWDDDGADAPVSYRKIRNTKFRVGDVGFRCVANVK